MIIDTASSTTAIAAVFKAAGVTSIWRYFDPIGPSSVKQVTKAEAELLAHLGLRLGLFSEGWGNFAHGAISAGAGERDAEYALRTFATIGAPSNAVIGFAVDQDATSAQIDKLVLPYFAAINKTFASTAYRVLAYGSGAVCTAVLAAKVADYTCLSCSTGWAGYQTFLDSGKWSMKQHVPTLLSGVWVDYDDQNPTLIEPLDFVPFAAP